MVNPEFQAVIETARSAYNAGLCVLPPVPNGTKRPTTILHKGRQTWEPFQSRQATMQEIEEWYSRTHMTGVGLVCGKVSRGLELFEFDHRGTYERFREVAAASGLGPLIQRIEAGYLEYTPGDGVHWLYYCRAVRDSTKLARRLKTPEEYSESDRKAIEAARKAGKEHRPIKVLVETKGEGGYVVTAPSFGRVHPSGQPYRLVSGGVDTIVSLTPEERESLWTLAKTFDEMGERPKPTVPPKPEGIFDDGGIPPWEDFNRCATWEEILEPHGWVKVYSHGEESFWRRPGKSEGVSATTNHLGYDGLYVFTSSTIFEQNKGFDKIGAYVRLEHGGNFADAARSLIAKGYGERPKHNGHATAQANGTPPADRAIVDARKPREEQPDAVIDDFRTINDDDLGILPLSRVECQPVRWLWKYRLSRGGFALMAGDGGIGKSQVLLWIGSTVTNGGPWADGSGNAPAGDVVIVSAEDRPDDTIKPRLMAMGANIERVTLVKAKYVVRRPGKPPLIHPASFQDRGYWKEIFRRRPDCKLFIVDPIPSYLGRGVNDSKNIEIRNILEPFIDEIIAPADVCMIGNTHLNKTVDAKTPMHRISGSIAYGALPRNVHFVVRDPDDPMRRFFKQAKCNNAPDDLQGIAFRIERREVVNGEGEVIETSIPVFEMEGVDCDLGAAVAGATCTTRRGPEPKKATAAAEWLHDFLLARNEPTPLGAIFDAAGEADLIGHLKEDGRWSNGALLYRAKDRVAELPEPRHGLEVAEFQMATRHGGRELVHWRLIVPGMDPLDD